MGEGRVGALRGKSENIPAPKNSAIYNEKLSSDD